MPRARSSPPEAWPSGFTYRPDFISEEEERDLLGRFTTLDFQVFDFQGYIARRRVIEYGLEYDFTARKANTAQPLPDFLMPLRDRAADFAGVTREEIIEAVLTEYTPGSPIGWHRDVPQFEVIVGVSLGSVCRLRLKPYRAEGKLVSTILEPRSAYIIRGDARWKYQHSIPAVEQLRYSVTFRTMRGVGKQTTERRPESY